MPPKFVPFTEEIAVGDKFTKTNRWEAWWRDTHNGKPSGVMTGAILAVDSIDFENDQPKFIHLSQGNYKVRMLYKQMSLLNRI